MQVKDIMTTKVMSVKPEQRVTEVADILNEHHFTGVPVLDTRGKLLGVISERDFIASDSKLYLPTYIKLLQEIDYLKTDKKFLPKQAQDIIHATAEDIMNRTVVTADAEMEIATLAELFAVKRVNPIPVVDANKKMIGIVSRSDLIRLFSEKHLPAEVEVGNINRPIDSNVLSVYDSFRSQFEYVAKARANIWITIAIVLFVIGFIVGIVYVADPHIFGTPTDGQVFGPSRDNLA